MRKERVDLTVYSRQHRRQAVWCGTVCALSVLFIVLNILPPVPVWYEVTGKVLVEPRRVEGLVHNLKRATSWNEPVVLRDFQVLARTQSDGSMGLADTTDSDRIFLRISSLWNMRCTSAEFTDWADDITRSSRKPEVDSELSSMVRMARWDLSLAEHYRKYHDSVVDFDVPSTAEEAANGSSRFQLAGQDGQRSMTQLVASSSETITTPIDYVSRELRWNELQQATDQGQKQHLQANVTVARQRLQHLESSLNQAIQEASGTVSLVDSTQIIPIADRIPFGMGLSVIVLLVSVGSTVAWCHFRLKSGGIYEPEEVAEQLAALGLPIVAKIDLPGDQLDSADWLELASRQASGASRKTGRNLVRLSEAVLGLWFLLICGRFFLDPLWRIVLLDSPLAAFGRLIAGLP